MPDSTAFRGPHGPLPALDPERDRARLLALLVRRSLLFGSFRLSSGTTSEFYIDVRKTSLDPEGAEYLGRLVCAAYAEEVTSGEVTAVGGLTLGADPLVVAFAGEAFRRGVRLEAFLVRKAPKEHGAENRIEGNLTAGARALILDDVCTSGESTVLAVEAARAAGATVTRTWCVVDRRAGGREALEARGVALTACLEVETLLAAGRAAQGR